MKKINDWLEEQQTTWQADFVGIARQVIDDNHCLVIKWCHVVGHTSQAYKKIKLQIGKGFAGEIWKTGRYQIISNLQSKQSEIYNYPIARIEHLDTIIGAPVFYQSKLIAVVIIGHRHLRQYSSEQQKHFIKLIEDLPKILMEAPNNETS